MAALAKKGSPVIVVEVLVPSDIAADQRARFEEGAVEFLFGPDRLRPELVDAIRKRGVDPNVLATLSEQQRLSVCPTPGALEFVPGPELTKLAAERGLKFTDGGEVRVEFNYAQAGKMNAASNVLYVNLRLPHGMAAEMTREATAELVRALFGDCRIPGRVQDYLRAQGIDLVNLAAGHSDSFRRGQVPPTTRVRPEVADSLKRCGFDVDQFGRLEVLEVGELTT
jgi:hypothetical protein